jgi:hypothetical protein
VESTIEILIAIRDESRATRTDLGERIDRTNERLDEREARLERVESRLDAIERARG